MQILDSEENLRSYLLTHENKYIKIVTAFAGGTEKLVSSLLDKMNVIELIIGTINAFTSPNFIKFCADSTHPNLTTFIDFRYQFSIHWKLYLIDPDIIIIGSANLTETGLSLKRDTCLIIENLKIYQEYTKKISALKVVNGLVKAEQTTIFNNFFDQYLIEHVRSQAHLALTKKFSTLNDWLSDETNQSLQLFIWDKNHSPKNKNDANTLLEANSVEGASIKVREFFTLFKKKSKLPFEQGDVVLCASRRGGHIGFYVFDRIIYSQGCYFIYSYQKKTYPMPFDLKPLTSNLKRLIPELYKNGNFIINRAGLKSLLIN